MDLLKMAQADLQQQLAGAGLEHWWQIFERGSAWLMVMAFFLAIFVVLPKGWWRWLWRWPR